MKDETDYSFEEDRFGSTVDREADNEKRYLLPLDD